jgi:hypothetical protein
MHKLKRVVDEQVRISFEEDEARGACLSTYSEAVHKDVEARIAAGHDIVSPLPRLYARGDFWRGLTPERRAIAKMRGLVTRHCDWIFRGASAAVLYGLSVSHRLLDVIEVASPSGTKTLYGGGVRTRHMNIDEEPCVFAQGLPVTPILRTLFDCARELPLRDAAAILDSALSLGLVNKDELIGYVDGKKNCTGAAQARFAARFADGRSGSGGESMARAAMWELGFAAPDLQTEFIDPVSGRHYFADFCWRAVDGRVIVGEFDGGEKYVDPRMTNGRAVASVMRAERLRESRLTALVDAVVRFSPAMVEDSVGFSRLLDTFGVPRDHDPIIEIDNAPAYDEVPLSAYGLA